MPAEPPGGWELQRALEQHRLDMREGFAGLNARLDKLVPAETFNAEQRRVDDRHKALTDSIAVEKAARIAAIADEKASRIAALADERKFREDGDKAQQTQLDKLTANIRWIAASLMVPVGLFIANIVINSRGGA